MASSISKMKYCVIWPHLKLVMFFLGQPYIGKRHAVYESQPRSVIVTLGGKLYRIPKTIAPKKFLQGRKISSHIRKLFLFTIVSEEEHKITETSTPSAQGVSAHQTQEEDRAIVSSSIQVPLQCKAMHSRCSSKNK